MDELQLDSEHSRLKVHKVQAEHEAYVRKSRENHEEKVKFFISVVLLITDHSYLKCISLSLSLILFSSVSGSSPGFLTNIGLNPDSLTSQSGGLYQISY